MRLRRSEGVLAGYFAYTAVLALVLPLRPHVPAVTVALNAVVIAGFVLLAQAESLRGREFAGTLCCSPGNPVPERPSAAARTRSGSPAGR